MGRAQRHYLEIWENHDKYTIVDKTCLLYLVKHVFEARGGALCGRQREDELDLAILGRQQTGLVRVWQQLHAQIVETLPDVHVLLEPRHAVIGVFFKLIMYHTCI